MRRTGRFFSCPKTGYLHKAFEKYDDVKGYKVYLLEDNKVLVLTDVIFQKAEGYVVSDEVLEERRKNWVPRAPKVTTGYLARYAEQVTSGNTGAILKVPGNK